MGYTSGTGTRGTDTFTDTPQTVADYQRLNDTIAKMIGRRIGTTVERNALATAEKFEGLRWKDTTDSIEYERVGSAWTPVESPWFAYTPTFTAFTAGASALDFKWRYTGAELVDVDWSIVLAAGFSVGSTPTFSLPISGQAPSHPHATISMNVSLYDTSAGTPREAYVRANVSSATTVALVGGSPSTPVTITASTPFTWATGDVLQGQFSYRTA